MPFSNARLPPARTTRLSGRTMRASLAMKAWPSKGRDPSVRDFGVQPGEGLSSGRHLPVQESEGRGRRTGDPRRVPGGTAGCGDLPNRITPSASAALRSSISSVASGSPRRCANSRYAASYIVNLCRSAKCTVALQACRSVSRSTLSGNRARSASVAVLKAPS